MLVGIFWFISIQELLIEVIKHCFSQKLVNNQTFLVSC